MLVVSEVQPRAEHALNERCDELESHQQRDVDVAQPEGVVSRVGWQRAVDIAVRVPVADIDVDVLRRGWIRGCRVWLVVYPVAVGRTQATAGCHEVDLAVGEAGAVQGLLHGGPELPGLPRGVFPGGAG